LKNRTHTILLRFRRARSKKPGGLYFQSYQKALREQQQRYLALDVASCLVIPAKAGNRVSPSQLLDYRFRGNDE